MKETLISKETEDYIKPDKDCIICKGSGISPVEGSSSVKQCVCILRQEAIKYLTPMYQQAIYLKDLETSSAIGVNFILSGKIDMSQFKCLVKSFLLNTGMRFRHRTLSGYDVVMSYVSNGELVDDLTLYQRLIQEDLIFLYLNHDPPNKGYGGVLSYFLKERMLLNKPTWVYSPIYDTPAFSFKYTDEVKVLIKDNFTSMNDFIKDYKNKNKNKNK